MGYTHYWNIKDQLTSAKFQEWSDGCKIIVATAMEAGIPLGDGMGLDAPLTEEIYVALNGVGEDGHESFGILIDDTGFDFCKTAAKPYDAVVTACLLYAKAIFGDVIELSSDGDWEDWQSGQILYETVFGVVSKNVFA